MWVAGGVARGGPRAGGLRPPAGGMVERWKGGKEQLNAGGPKGRSARASRSYAEWVGARPRPAFHLSTLQRGAERRAIRSTRRGAERPAAPCKSTRPRNPQNFVPKQGTFGYT